jgi:hypothetical protein
MHRLGKHGSRPNCDPLASCTFPPHMGAWPSCTRGAKGGEAEAEEAAAHITLSCDATRLVLGLLTPYLPLSTRARCMRVCRAWRDALGDPSYWARLDILPRVDFYNCGNAFFLVRDYVDVHGAAACARGTLRELNIGGHTSEPEVTDKLLPLVAANVRTLRTLSFSCDTWEFAVVAVGDAPFGAVAVSKLWRARAAAARRPRASRMIVAEQGAVVDPRLRDSPYFALRYMQPYEDPRMQLQSVQLAADGDEAAQQQRVLLFSVHTIADEDADAAALDEWGTLFAPLPEATAGTAARALAAEIETHSSLLRLELRDFMLDTPATLRAIVAAVHARRLARLELHKCNISVAVMPALTALFGSASALRDFSFSHGELPLDEDSAATLGDSVCVSSALSAFTLCGARGMAAGALRRLVQRGFVAHPSLQKLELLNSRSGEAADFAGCVDAGVAAQLGVMLAADAPALLELSVDCRSRNDASEAAMAPLFAALAHNTHLRVLLFQNELVREAFAAGVLLPALRVNKSLRVLGLDGEHIVTNSAFSHADHNNRLLLSNTAPSAVEAQRLVHRRAVEALMFGVVTQPPPASYELPPLELRSGVR